MTRINIRSGSLSFQATLADNASGQGLASILPLSGRANTWGDEIYFSIPLEAELEVGATDQLPAGSLAFWPPGNAFCIIWGPTPASQGDEPRFASPVNLLGSIESDLGPLSRIRDGDEVVIEAV